MYQVIARKYRPQTFEELLGQGHIKQTLRNAIEQGRVGHAYIFSGPRGTGKTTTARILAMALNCEQGPTPKPDPNSPVCQEIAAGGALDVVEIDAASNRGIDEMRRLRQNVQYRPVRDRYKIFIIDEAHQITTDAFNALLKTLEEPPEWMVFVLCTTEPQAIPATILSRCQHFAFQPVDIDEVLQHLGRICDSEGVTAEDDALAAIALAGDGSVRDSLSALDQAIAAFGNSLEAAAVRNLIGAISSESADRILAAIRDSDQAEMLKAVDDMFRQGHHPQYFCGELARHFRNLLVMKLAGTGTRLVSAGAREREAAGPWIDHFSEDDLTRFVNLLLSLYSELQDCTHQRFRLEVGLLKLVHAARLVPIEEVIGGLGRPSHPIPAPASGVSRPTAAPPTGGPSRRASPKPQAKRPAAPLSLKDKLLHRLRSSDGTETVTEILEGGTVELDGRTLRLTVDSDRKGVFELQRPVLEAAALSAVGKKVRISIEADETSRPPAARADAQAAGNSQQPSLGFEERAKADPAVRAITDHHPGRLVGVADLRS
ncbi:MAG: DNA polymerase III subunit gamma/tau [Bryobacterales bacterium]|nr:DNA polymerase III subunit gamma/tau [Bryobacterales bacterium]